MFNRQNTIMLRKKLRNKIDLIYMEGKSRMNIVRHTRKPAFTCCFSLYYVKKLMKQ